MSTPITNIAPPADATAVHRWLTPADGVVRRMFVGTMRGDGVHVNIMGRQHADGSVQRFINSDAGYLRHEFDPAGAREHARQLMAAADELELLEMDTSTPGLSALGGVVDAIAAAVGWALEARRRCRPLAGESD